MTRFRRLQGGAGGDSVANFAEEDDIRTLTKGAAEAFGKGGGISSYFTLSKATKVFLKKIFNGVLDGDDVAGGGLI